MPSNTDYPFEILKLVLQLAGALFIARMTVTWALRRFKTEKLWERQVTALADVLAAVTELDRINTVWFDLAITRCEPTEEGSMTAAVILSIVAISSAENMLTSAARSGTNSCRAPTGVRFCRATTAP